MSLSTVNLAPGVYVEELFSLAFSVKSGATAVPVFVGYFLNKDSTPRTLDKGCVRITNWMDLETQFYSGMVKVTINGETTGPKDGDGGGDDQDPAPGPFSVSPLADRQLTSLLMLRHYFDNGGGACYVLSFSESDELNNLAHEIDKFPDISLLVAAVAAGDAATVCGKLSSVLSRDGYRDKGHFMIAHGSSATDTDKPNGYQDDQTAFYAPYLKTPYAYWRSDNAVVVEGYEEDDEGGGSSATLLVDEEEPLYLSDLAIRDAELHAEIARYIDNLLKNTPVPDLPPSAAVAGAYCRTDRERGVWKAPANVELSAVTGVSVRIGDEQHGRLNTDGVNVIRWFDNRGAVIYGARTLDTSSNDNWRYIQVRRLFGAAERDIKRAVSAAMFEPNNAPTWEAVRVAIDNYLYSLWRQGALMGNTPAEAYFVRIGKGITMTDDDIENGRMIVKIGMSAVRPAEFILLEFTQRVGLG